jgi:hypothetical protein
MLPIVYLFIAVGVWTLERAVRRGKPIMRVLLALAAVVSAGTNVQAYFDWAASDALERPLHPAVPRAMFEQWWTDQVSFIRSGRGFLNVGAWRAAHGLEDAEGKPGRLPEASEPAPAPPAPPRPRRTPEGPIYRGSTSGKPYEIDLGTVQTAEGVIEVEVFAVPGFDAVYDYLDLADANGTTTRVEAESSRYTTGDQPVSVHINDNHWWLQSYEPFSDGRGLVALKSERPPPLLTRVAPGPGIYRLRLGSFTGDPHNGPFAVQVSAHAGK